MASYMSYEETIPIIRASVFNSFNIYEVGEIIALIDQLPEKPIKINMLKHCA